MRSRSPLETTGWVKKTFFLGRGGLYYRARHRKPTWAVKPRREPLFRRPASMNGARKRKWCWQQTHVHGNAKTLYQRVAFGTHISKCSVTNSFQFIPILIYSKLSPSAPPTGDCFVWFFYRVASPDAVNLNCNLQTRRGEKKMRALFLRLNRGRSGVRLDCPHTEFYIGPAPSPMDMRRRRI